MFNAKKTNALSATTGTISSATKKRATEKSQMTRDEQNAER